MIPADCDHPVWKKALTYRQLLRNLQDLSEEQLEETVAIREPFSNGGSGMFPVHGFSIKPEPGLGVGSYLTRMPMSKPQCDCKIYIL